MKMNSKSCVSLEAIFVLCNTTVIIIRKSSVLIIFCLSVLVLVLESVTVQRVFLNKLIDVALAWHRNIPELPPARSQFLRCSVHAIKNTRRKMEDKHVTIAEFNQLFGIQVQDLNYKTIFCLSLFFLSSNSLSHDDQTPAIHQTGNISFNTNSTVLFLITHKPGRSGAGLLCCV